MAQGNSGQVSQRAEAREHRSNAPIKQLGESEKIPLLELVLVTIAIALFFLACAILHEFGKQHLLWRLVAIAVLILTTVFLLLVLCTEAKTDASDDSSTSNDDATDSKLLPTRMKYAWDWFQYHADQRLKAFNFFLVILGILIVAYGAAMKEGLTNAANRADSTTTTKAESTSSTPPSSSTTSTTSTTLSNPAAAAAAESYSNYAAAVALCGVVISIAFFMIEIRNTELVDCGRDCLDRFEPALDMRLRRADRDREHLNKIVRRLVPQGRSPRKRFITHWFWMRLIYGMACLGFMLAFSRALCGF
jgi:hypothetical protein